MNKSPFERGIAILSFDTEQIWGYVDSFSEEQFTRHYPDAIPAHDRLLDRLCAGNIRATWFIVGGMTLAGSGGGADPRLRGLPSRWTRRIPAGDEQTASLWYRRSFLQRLKQARVEQEIGLHGGLTHLIWSDPEMTREVAARELTEGIRALSEVGLTPTTFSHPREQEKYYDLLAENGITCYRSRTPTLAFRLGRTLPGAALRIADEMRHAAPPVVWPREKMPGLWTIPASLFLYPIGPSRTRIVPLRSRVRRFRKGVEAAVRRCGIFHYCFHPDNLTESPDGFAMLDEMLDALTQARDRGDIEIRGMGDVAQSMRSKSRARDGAAII